MPAILLLSPYDCLSHRYWREALADYLGANHNADVTTVTLPPRFFSWRHRGNSLTLSHDSRLDRDYDLIIATSMTDLSALRGLRRRLASIPAIVYCHENQFAFPDRSMEGLIERQVTSVYTALSADRLVFNSAFNRDSFLDGAEALLRKMPDGVPGDVVSNLTGKSHVIPVALENPGIEVRPASDRRLRRIVWNHRWEHDKNPAQLLAIVEGLIDTGVPFSMSLLGERYAETPDHMQLVVDRLKASNALFCNRFVEDRREYLELLSEHDQVLSTASQEFQGLAVQEAMLCGCQPVVPDALVYPEYVPATHRFSDTSEAVRLLTAPLKASFNPKLEAYTWKVVGPAWSELMTGFRL